VESAGVVDVDVLTVGDREGRREWEAVMRWERSWRPCNGNGDDDDALAARGV